MFRQFLQFIITIPVLLLISCSENSKQAPVAQSRPVKAIQIGNTKTFNSRSFPGKAKATQEINLSFNESGSLIAFPLKIGDKVKKGELIAKLDPREFEAKLKSAQAETKRDEQNYLRAKTLVGKGYVSKTDYELLSAKYLVSKSNMDLAEKALMDSVIKAPFDGQIADLYVENFQTVSKQQSIARLLDISQIEMVIQVPENAISLIRHAKNIVVQFDAFPDHLIPAQIREISSEASPDTRTYPVTLIMQQPKDIEILPGMAGKVKGKIESGKSIQNKISIPLSSLITMEKDGKSYVWVIDTKTWRIHRREVTIDEPGAAGISISGGLHADEWIVTAGVHSLQEGDSITILNEKDE